MRLAGGRTSWKAESRGAAAESGAGAACAANGCAVMGASGKALIAAGWQHSIAVRGAFVRQHEWALDAAAEAAPPMHAASPKASPHANTLRHSLTE